MKVYRVELMILDFDEIGADGIAQELENARYANHCISPHVMSLDCREIGAWEDAHPLNSRNTMRDFFKRLFLS